MFTFEEEKKILEVLGELPLSEFNKACEKAGVSDSLKKAILDFLEAEGD